MKEHDYPRITYNHPTNNELGVSLDTKIEVKFTIDINPDTLDASTFFVTENGSFIEGEVEYNNQVAEFIPKEELKTDKEYKVTLKGGLNKEEDIILDTFDNPLPEDYIYTFKTRKYQEIPQPRIISPSDKTIVSNELFIEWEKIEDVDNYDVEICTDKLFNNIVYSTTVINNSIKPFGVEKNKEYFLRVRANVKQDSSEWSNIVNFYFEEKETEGDADDQPNNVFEVLNIETQNVSKDTSEIIFTIPENIISKEEIDIELIGNSVKNIPGIEADNSVDGELEIMKQDKESTTIKYVI